MLSLDGWIDANTMIAINVQSESLSQSGDFGVIMTENEPDPVTITVRTLCMRDYTNITSQLPHWFNDSEGYGYPWDMATWGTLLISDLTILTSNIFIFINFWKHKHFQNLLRFMPMSVFEVNFLDTGGAWMKSHFLSTLIRVHYRYFCQQSLFNLHFNMTI